MTPDRGAGNTTIRKRTDGSTVDDEVNRGYLAHIRLWSAKGLTRRKFVHSLLHSNATRLVLLPWLFAAALFVILRLRLSLIVRNGAGSALHDEALTCLDGLAEQYPFHLYPIVAKALELACLKRQLASFVDAAAKIVEVAVGEGTLSSRLFSNDTTITALDLNPYSLVKALKFRHIGQAAVCDGLNPPLRPGGFNVLLAANFLNHITQKESTLSNWARAAEFMLFTENTLCWATGWSIPYAAARMGLRRFAQKYARRIEENNMQQLETIDALTRRVGGQVGIDLVERTSFMSERTFFYSSVFSLCMRCYGPPTPMALKKLFLGPLRWCAVPMTKALARTLIQFDATEDRASDTFVVFVCRSRNFQRASGDQDFVCPCCRGPLKDATCTRCGARYRAKDGMLFLLPEEFRFIETEYDSEKAMLIPAEHL